MAGGRLVPMVVLMARLLACCPAPIAAQSPADTRLLAELDDAIGTATTANQQEADDPVARDLQTGLNEVAQFLRNGKRGTLERALFRFARSSIRRPDWAWPDYAMAHAFLLLHDLGAPLLDSEGSRLGESHLAAMWRHLHEALRRDPDFLRVRVLLSDLAYAGGDRELHDDMQEALATEVSRHDPLPEALVAWGRHKRTQGDYRIALAIFDRAGQLGADRSVVALERARTLEALDRPEAARAAYWRGVDELTDRGRQLYRQDLGWILDDDSLATFDAVPDSEVAGWMHRFWGQRDAAAVQDSGHREVEHLRRWVYAFATFRVHNPWTRIARTRVDFAFDDIRDQCVGNASSFYQQLPVVPPALPGDIRSSEALLDHRGIIYLRHGEPFARAVPPAVAAEEGGPQADAAATAGIVAGQEGARLDESLRGVEVWVYWAEGAWRVFQFRGSDALGHDAATTMSSYLPWQSAQAWQALARMLPAYRLAANRIANYRGIEKRTCLPDVHTAVVQQREDAVIGINSDTERPPILEPWSATHRFFAIGRGLDDSVRALITFAVPTSDLTARALNDGRVLWRLRFHLVAYRLGDGRRIDIDTTRAFAAPRRTTTGFLTGWFDLPLGPGRWQVAVLARQPGDTTAGSYALRRSLDLGSSDSLSLSDVVTGRSDQPGWPAPDGPFPVNALGFWPNDGAVELWYQVGGLAAGDEFHTTLAVAPESDAAHPAIQVSTIDRAVGSVTTARKSVGLEHLAPGRYFLRVTIEAGDRSVTREQVILVTRKPEP